MKTNILILLLLVAILLIETVIMLLQKEYIPALLFIAMLVIALGEVYRLYKSK